MQSWQTLRHWTPILMFHEVLPAAQVADSPYALTPERLRAILTAFTRRGYTSGSLADVLAPPRGRRLVLTFDDGTADFLEHALPILEEFHFRATLFIVADFVGGQRRWNMRDGTPMTPVPLLGADDLRALAARGFTIGSHSLTHRPLTNLAPAEAEMEIRDSRTRLAELLDGPVEWFAYPYVAVDAATQARVRTAGYLGACGGYHQAHNRYYLTRVEASVFSVRQLLQRSSGLFHFTRGLLRSARRLRAARA